MGLLSDISDIGPDVTLDELLKRFAPSDADLKTARGHAWIQTGLGILANAGRMPTMNAVGIGGLSGLNSYNQEIGQLQGQGLRNMQGVSAALGVQNQLQNMRDLQGVRQTLREQAPIAPPPAPQALPQMGPPEPPPPAPAPQIPGPPQYSTNFSGGPLTAKQKAAVAADIANNGYVPATAAPQPQAPAPDAQQAPQAVGPIVQKRAMAQQYLKTAQALTDKGYVEQAQRYFDMAQKVLPESAGTETLMQNGKPVTVQKYKDGSVEVMSGFNPTPDIMHVDTGNGIQMIDKRTLQGVGALAKGMSPDAVASNTLGQARLAETQRHNASIEGDPDMIEATAKMIADGKQAPLSGWAMSKPSGQAIMARVMQINPDYNAQDYGTQQKAMKDFATGKNGNTIRSLNVAIDHLDTLSQAATALNNNDVQLFNKVGNAIQSQTGNPAPTNFAATKKIVADEIVKAIVGSGGGVTDREEAAKAIDGANSPAQLAGVIGQYKKLLGGQLGGLKQQYEQTTGRQDFEKFLSPNVKTQLQGLPATGGKTVVRLGTDASGKRVAQYSDGTVGPAP